MKTEDFSFELPQELIAQYPALMRGQSRLMTLNRKTGKRFHKELIQLPEILCEEPFLNALGEKPLLVFNDSKVRKARLTGFSPQVESCADFLLLEEKENRWKTLVKHTKRRKPGQIFLFNDKTGNEINRAVIKESGGEFCYLEFEKTIDDDWLEKYGSMPLPPYIKRKDETLDASRYQTVYAAYSGSAAAPTAGLHFTEEILNEFSANGIESVFLTLHVGLGTFLPVRCSDLSDHIMHEEQFIITCDAAQKIEEAKKEGKKIIAIGTTSLRALESAVFTNESGGQKIKHGRQSTSIFIYPGYEFKITDALFTNFHTPLSTLLMLVCAFAGRELILESYAEAVKEGYRFFSYGDAILIY